MLPRCSIRKDTGCIWGEQLKWTNLLWVSSLESKCRCWRITRWTRKDLMQANRCYAKMSWNECTGAYGVCWLCCVWIHAWAEPNFWRVFHKEIKWSQCTNMLQLWSDWELISYCKNYVHEEGTVLKAIKALGNAVLMFFFMVASCTFVDVAEEN